MSFGGRKFLRIVQVLIVVALLYGLDHTPLNAERIVAYFHLGTLGAFVFALVGILVLWQVSKMVLGLLLLVFGTLMISRGRQD
jgi:sulfite exporter TauE/SafE